MAALGFDADLIVGTFSTDWFAVPASPTFSLEAGEAAMYDTNMDGILDRELNPDRQVLIAEGGTGSGGDIISPVPPQYIRGTVTDVDGYGVARTVIAVDRATGKRLAIATSDVGGSFELRPRTLDPCILVAVPIDGEQLNAVVLDNILPVAS